MNREDILAKSRAENKNRDVYEGEVHRKGMAWGNVGMLTLATVFFGLKISLTGEPDYGFYGIVCMSFMVTFWYKWAFLKRKHEFWTAVMYTLCTLGFSAVYVIGLLK